MHRVRMATKRTRFGKLGLIAYRFDFIMSQINHQITHQAQVGEFFDGWSVYQKLLDSNAMFHRELYHGLREALAYRRSVLAGEASHGFSLLDLGCGNAAFMASVLADHPGMDYLGVDLSSVALERAGSMLHSMPVRAHLLQIDMQQALDQLLAEGRTFDVVFSGYALHHLQAWEKCELLKGLARLLGPDGQLMVIDMFMAPDEDREHYMQAVDTYVRGHWTALLSDEAEAVMAHIRQYDFPETPDQFREMASLAGFSAAERRLCRDRWFQLWVLSR